VISAKGLNIRKGVLNNNNNNNNNNVPSFLPGT
jgi:hypothetical protein